MTVSAIASKIYQAAKKANTGEWIWRTEWSKAMKKACRRVMKKESVIERKAKNSPLMKGVRMAVDYQSAPIDQLLARELKGTPKQVAWAKSIVDNFVTAAKKEIESAVIRAEEGSMPNRWAYIVLDTVLDICTTVSSNAGQIISNRGQLSASLISSRAVAKYNA